jgi:hypothetical protein
MEGERLERDGETRGGTVRLLPGRSPCLGFFLPAGDARCGDPASPRPPSRGLGPWWPALRSSRPGTHAPFALFFPAGAGGLARVLGGKPYPGAASGGAPSRVCGHTTWL